MKKPIIVGTASCAELKKLAEKNAVVMIPMELLNSTVPIFPWPQTPYWPSGLLSARQRDVG